jgi:hypothetical protein
MVITAFTHVVTKSIYLVTLVLWLLPLFRQANGKFFYYFYCLAISQSAALILYYFFKLPVYFAYAPLSYLITLTVFGCKTKLKRGLLLINTTLLIIVTFWQHSYASHLAAFYHILLLGYFMALFMKKYFTRDIIHLYILMLVVYEFSTTLLFSLRFVRTRINIAFSTILALFEVLICVFFIVYSFKDSPRIYLPRQKKSDFV